MQQAKENIVGPYRLKLNPNAKTWRENARYDEKIKGIKGLDPYEHSDWSGEVNLLHTQLHDIKC